MRKIAIVLMVCLTAAAPGAAAESTLQDVDATVQITRDTTYEQAAAAAVQMSFAAKAASDLASLLARKADAAQIAAHASAQLAQAALLSGNGAYDILQTRALEDQLAANRLWTDAEHAGVLAEDARRVAEAAELTAVNALNAAASLGPVSSDARAKVGRMLETNSLSAQ